MIGRITDDPFVETVKNGEAKALFAQVELPNKEVRTVQIFPGIDADLWPCKGDVVVVERAGGLLYAAAVWDKEEPALKPGEREVYSRSTSRKRTATSRMDQAGNITTWAEGNVETTIEKNVSTTIGGDNKRETTGATTILEHSKRNYKNGADVNEEITNDKNVITGRDSNNKAGGKFYFGNDSENLCGLLLGIIDLIEKHFDIQMQTTSPLYITTELEPFKLKIKALLKEG